MKNIKPIRLQELKEMLNQWQLTGMVRATRYYTEIEQQQDAFERGYRMALGDVIRKIEDNNF